MEVNDGRLQNKAKQIADFQNEIYKKGGWIQKWRYKVMNLTLQPLYDKLQESESYKNESFENEQHEDGKGHGGVQCKRKKIRWQT